MNNNLAKEKQCLPPVLRRWNQNKRSVGLTTRINIELYKKTNILIVVIKHNLLPRDQEQTSWNYIQACSEEALPTKSKILLLGKLQYPRNR